MDPGGLCRRTGRTPRALNATGWTPLGAPGRPLTVGRAGFARPPARPLELDQRLLSPIEDVVALLDLRRVSRTMAAVRGEREPRRLGAREGSPFASLLRSDREPPVPLDEPGLLEAHRPWACSRRQGTPLTASVTTMRCVLRSSPRTCSASSRTKGGEMGWSVGWGHFVSTASDVGPDLGLSSSRWGCLGRADRGVDQRIRSPDRSASRRVDRIPGWADRCRWSPW